jgi:hypothetical protein
MKTIVIGVMPQEQVRARTIAIAKGEYRPKPGEPKIWLMLTPLGMLPRPARTRSDGVGSRHRSRPMSRGLE